MTERSKKPADAAKPKKRVLLTILGIIFCVVLIPVIVLNVILIAGTYVNPDSLPGLFGYKPLIVLSGSMEPVIHTGDMILVREADTAALETGDVISYLNDGVAITHRIEEIEVVDGQTQYITRGDANDVNDRLSVRPEQVQGVYTGIRFGGMGNFAMFMQSPSGMILFIICPLMLLIVYDILRRGSQDKKAQRQAAALQAEIARLKEQQANG